MAERQHGVHTYAPVPSARRPTHHPIPRPITTIAAATAPPIAAPRRPSTVEDRLHFEILTVYHPTPQPPHHPAPPPHPQAPQRGRRPRTGTPWPAQQKDKTGREKVQAPHKMNNPRTHAPQRATSADTADRQSAVSAQ